MTFTTPSPLILNKQAAGRVWGEEGTYEFHGLGVINLKMFVIRTGRAVKRTRELGQSAISF